MEKSNRNVRFKRLFLLMVFGLVATGLQAQVSVTVNGDRTYTLSGNSGIYFNNDTMWVGNDEYPLESVQIITFRTVLGINEDLTDRHIIIVEDIVDTGQTMKRMIETLGTRNPASVSVCALLMKPDKLQVELDVRYCALKIPNDFIVGYGLDYDQGGRGLKDIYTVCE